MDLSTHFGAIDVYLFDQLLRGRIDNSMRILDAGCGGGRNLIYMLREGFDVSAVDTEPAAVGKTRRLAARIDQGFDLAGIRIASVSDLPYGDNAFDVVISCAVLHFAPDEATFLAMIDEMGRVLAPGGLFFARLASSIGIEDRIVSLGGNRYRLPDGSDRYLVNEATLIQLTKRLGGALLDPIKTTNVQGLRCMTTWVVRAAAP